MWYSYLSITYLYITVPEPRNPSCNLFFASYMTKVVQMILTSNIYWVFYFRNHENYLSGFVPFSELGSLDL